MPRARRRACSGEGDLSGVIRRAGPLLKIGDGLGNQPLENRSMEDRGRWAVGESTASLRGGEGLADAGGSLEIGVILGKGNPLNAPPADDDDVLLPQLELRLPPEAH